MRHPILFGLIVIADIVLAWVLATYSHNPVVDLPILFAAGILLTVVSL